MAVRVTYRRCNEVDIPPREKNGSSLVKKYFLRSRVCLILHITRQGDGSGDGTFSVEFEGGVASVPFSAGPAVLLAAIEANITDPTGSLQDSFVSLEQATSSKRSYLVTFPRDLGDVATMVGYGDSGVLKVTITEETPGSLQVIRV